MHAEKSNDQITSFLKESDAFATPKEKTLHALQFMEKWLNEPKAPFFKGFWAAKDRAFEQLKLITNEPELWARYKELTDEFSKVKALVQEQSRFTMEQVELALEALKAKIAQPIAAHEIQEKDALTTSDVEELERLEGTTRTTKGFIDQLMALRNEVVKSPGIFKNKTKLITELNALIDQLLPVRKEAQNALCNHLTGIVTQFEQKPKSGPAHHLLKQVKSLQALLKELTLHPKTFQEARKILSRCWEKSKADQDAFKQAQSEKRKSDEAMVAQFKQRLEEIKASIEKLSPDQAKDHSRNLKQQVKRFYLPPKEAQALFDEVDAILDPVFEKEVAVRRKTVDALERTETSRKGQIHQLQTLLDTAAQCAVAEEIQTHLDQASNLLKGLQLSLEERVLLEPLYKSLSDKMLENCLKTATGEERKALLYRFYQERSRAQSALEELKRLANVTSQDFHQALLNHQLAEMETLRLKGLEEIIEELEEELEAVG